MIARLIIRLKSPMEQAVDSVCQRFPLLSSICIQVAAAVFMIGVVGTIAGIGGTVIWVFYRLFGVM